MEADPCLPPAPHASHGAARHFAPHRLVGRVRASGHHAVGKIAQLRHPDASCGKHLAANGELAARPTAAAPHPAPAGVLTKLAGAKAAKLLGAASLAGALALASTGTGNGAGSPPIAIDGGSPPGVHVTGPGTSPAPTAPPAHGLPVPEPGSLALLLAALGIGLIAGGGRRLKHR